MSVDLSKLKVNDTIELRDGTRHVVTAFRRTGSGLYPFCVSYGGDEDTFTEDGHLYVDEMDHPVDIVRILPAAVKTTGGVWVQEYTGDTPPPMPPPATGGIKHDSDKPALALLPFRATEEVAKVLAFGAKKYDAWNWKKGFAWSRLIGAALRHLFAFARGEDKDAETGLSHLAHAACCVLFLLEHELESLGSDDRWKGGAA